MTVLVQNIPLPPGYTEGDLLHALANALGASVSDILSYALTKKSVDARKKTNIKWVVSAAVTLREAGTLPPNVSLYTPAKTRLEDLELPTPRKDLRVAVVGAGPAGLFAALTLARAGLKPVLFERGQPAAERAATVEQFEKTGVLNTASNLQFGEGGAGAFSDGKLNSGISNALTSTVIGEFCAHGAPTEILYMSRPHIGTDYLLPVVTALRGSILKAGGTVHFNTQVEDIILQNGRIVGLKTAGEAGGVHHFDAVIFAVGHSARDTYEMLLARGLRMEQKPFSMGVRIEHLQTDINKMQYGGELRMPPAAYQLAAHLPNGRSVYTFCMCPGGAVVSAPSEQGGVTTNGMSRFARDGNNANAAVLVGVGQKDFASEHPLAGIAFQRRYEQLAYNVSKDYRLPVQTVGDFLAGKTGTAFGRVQPSCPRGTVAADINALLPAYVAAGIQEGFTAFDKKMKGFLQKDAVLSGVETRSSAPVRILRDANGESSLPGLYPAGEGAGYAGGIMSSAVDGIKAAMRCIAASD